MKREDLKAIGLTDEQIDKVMTENGKDIEKYKSSAEASKAEAESVKNQLTEANKQIESFKSMDIEGVKKSADEWKAKAEKAAADAEAQIKSLKFDHALDGALSSAKAKNAKAVKALLELQNLKLNEADGSIIGLDDQLKKIKEANDYLFESETTEPKIVLGGNNKTVVTDTAVRAFREAAGLPVGDK